MTKTAKLEGDRTVFVVEPTNERPPMPPPPPEEPKAKAKSKPAPKSRIGKIDPEQAARSKLELANRLLQAGDRKAAEDWLRRLMDEFPDTAAAKEAKKLLDSL